MNVDRNHGFVRRARARSCSGSPGRWPQLHSRDRRRLRRATYVRGSTKTGCSAARIRSAATARISSLRRIGSARCTAASSRSSQVLKAPADGDVVGLRSREFRRHHGAAHADRQPARARRAADAALRDDRRAAARRTGRRGACARSAARLQRPHGSARAQQLHRRAAASGPRREPSVLARCQPLVPDGLRDDFAESQATFQSLLPTRCNAQAAGFDDKSMQTFIRSRCLVNAWARTRAGS